MATISMSSIGFPRPDGPPCTVKYEVCSQLTFAFTGSAAAGRLLPYSPARGADPQVGLPHLPPAEHQLPTRHIHLPPLMGCYSVLSLWYKMR